MSSSVSAAFALPAGNPLPIFPAWSTHLWDFCKNWKWSLPRSSSTLLWLTVFASTLNDWSANMSWHCTRRSWDKRDFAPWASRSIVCPWLFRGCSKTASNWLDMIVQATNCSIPWDGKQPDTRYAASCIVRAQNVFPSFVTLNLGKALTTWETRPRLLSCIQSIPRNWK